MKILDYDIAIAELSKNIDVENVEQLLSYSEPHKEFYFKLI